MSHHHHHHAEFTTGLFGCFEDCGSCLVTLFCPCITLGQNKAMLDNREATFCDYLCAFGSQPVSGEYFTRQHIRTKYGLPEENCGDCMTMLFCTACAVCQHHRELRNRQRMVPATPVQQTMYHN